MHQKDSENFFPSFLMGNDCILLFKMTALTLQNKENEESM